MNKQQFRRMAKISKVVDLFNGHHKDDISSVELVEMIAKESECSEEEVLEIIAAGIKVRGERDTEREQRYEQKR